MATKSLGQLTIDVIAQVGGFIEGMDKSERASAKWRRQVEKDLKQVAKVAAGAATAAAGAVAAIAASTIRTADEIARLSAASGVGAEEFQRYAVGARLVGVEQDKLADIFRDTNDKIGDFLQTGGGALADFFENIAPQVGVTADQFRNLSGPQALELYVSSLEKANVSQNEMTFYMEAIASDATLLLPLLRDNAEGFKALGEEAADAGSILSTDTIVSAQEMRAAMFLLQNAGTGLRNQIADELLPTMSDLAGELSNVTLEGHFAEDAADLIEGAFKKVASVAVGAYAGVQLLGQGLAGLGAIGDELTKGETWVERWIGKFMPILRAPRAISNLKNVGDVAGQVGDDLDGLAQKYGAIINMIQGLGEDEGVDRQSRIKEIAELMAESRKQAEAALASMREGGISDGDVGLDGLTEQQKAYQELVRALRTDEEKLTDQMRERFAVLDAINDITDEERAGVSRRIADAGFMDAPDVEGISPEIGGPFAEFRRLDDQQAEVEEWYSQQLEMLEQYREERADLGAVWDAKEEELFKQHQDRLSDIEASRNQVRLAAAESVAGDLADIAKGFAGEQSDAYKTLFAISKGFSLAQSAISIATGIARANELGFPANLAEMARVAATGAAITSTIKSASYAGAFDAGGDIPAGMFGIVGEKGPEIVAGPVSVTGRRDTQAVFDRMAREKAANDEQVNVTPVTNVYINGVKQPADREQVRGMAREVVIEEVSNKASKTMRSLNAQTNVRPKGNY